MAMDGWRREAPSADAFRVVIDEGENAIRRRARAASAAADKV